MNHLQRFWQHKKARYITLGILAVVVAAGILFGSVLLMRQQYAQAVTTWHQALQANFETNGNKIADNKNADITVTALNDAQKQLNIWSAPAQPKFLGIAITSTTTQQAESAAKAQATKVVMAIENTKAFLAYQKAVLPPLNSLSGKSTENLEQLKKLEGEWQAAVRTVAAVKPPESAKAFHQSFTRTLEGSAADLAAMVLLFEKRDTAGFNAKKEEFSNKISALQNLGDQFATLAKAQDVELAKQLHELDHLVANITAN